MSAEYLFVYGTLRRGSRNPAQLAMLRYTHFVANGTVQGRLYLVTHYPALVLAEPAYPVLGELFLVKQPDKLWPLLDSYEGIGPQFCAPYEYEKMLITVNCADGKRYLATAYLYNWPTTNLTLLPSGNFLDGG